MPIEMSQDKWREALKFVLANQNLFPMGTASEVVRRCHFPASEPPLDINKMEKITRERYLLEKYSLF